MQRRLRATTERVERSVARVVRSATVATGVIGDGDMTALATMLPMGVQGTQAIAWNVKPSVHQTAFCTFGTYHTRRLQEMPT